MATINGGAGDESLNGTTDPDEILAGDGNDTVTGDAGNDSISGGDGQDSLLGGAGTDTIHGDAGDDTIDGGTDGDTITGGDGNDSVSGGHGDDTLGGGTGEDTILGGDGNDTVSGSTGNDSIRGGEGDDTLSGGADNDTIHGDAGTDTLFGDGGDDSLDGGDGNDSVSGGSGNDSLAGGGDDDTLRGGAGDDTMLGETGNDSIVGEDGEDSVFAGDGADTVLGGNDDDTIWGDAGDDGLRGEGGDDALHGGDGADTLDGGAGSDYFDGGAGDDLFVMGGPDPTENDVVHFHAGAGTDHAEGFDPENDYIFIGNLPESDIVFVPTADPHIWEVSIAGGDPADTLTLDFTGHPNPIAEPDLRKQLVTDSEYTPPANGNKASLNPACFSPDSFILTPNGPRQIGMLRAAELVITLDNGPQPVQQVLGRSYDRAQIRDHKSLRPIIIEAGAFGPSRPSRRMILSRQHGILARDGTALIRAAHVVEELGAARIECDPAGGVRYAHILLQSHNLVQVDGIWCETVFNGPSDPPDLRHVLTAEERRMSTIRCRPLLSRAALRAEPVDRHSLGCDSPALSALA